MILSKYRQILEEKMRTIKVNKKLLAQIALTLFILFIIVDAVRKAMQNQSIDDNAPHIPESLTSAMVYHDFEMDVTVIVDKASKQCFIAPLEKSLPPEDADLQALLDKMQRGEYNPSQETLNQSYKVLIPPVHQLNDYGAHVMNACKDNRAYRLSKIKGVVQGSQCDSVQLAWNTGSKLVNAHIFYCR